MRRNKCSRHSAKIFALLMSAVLTFGTVMPVNAAEKKEKKEDKTETVYINAAADGTVDKVTVSDWLQNHDNSDTLSDYSNLENIKNVKGDETYTQNEDGSIVWDSRGNDIYYQGETSEELPVSMKVSYYLDGEKIDPADLAGKSGKVKIRFDYYNNSDETVKVKGKEYQVQTPFTMMTALIMPTDTFTNVKVSNGTVLTDGDKNIVVGLGFPGLKDSLRLSSYEQLSDISMPEYVEVTADAKDFSLALSLTAATTGNLDELNLGDLSDADDLKKDIDELTDASTQLVDGSKELADGLDTLSSSFGTFSDGLSDADAGAGELKKGLKKLDSKKVELSQGVQSLSDGLKTLKTGTASLNQGIKDYTNGVSSLDTGLATAGTGASSLQQGAGALSAGLKSYTDGVSQLKTGINQLNEEVSAMGNITLPDDKTMTAVKNAAAALEKDAQTLQASAGAITATMEKINGLAETVKKHNEEVATRFNQAKNALDGIDKKATEKANSQLKDQESAVETSAKDQAVADAKAAVDQVEGLTDEQKSALKNAMENKISVDVTLKDIQIKGLGQDAKDSLNDVPKLDLPIIELNLDTMAQLLQDMKKQAAVLEKFAESTGELTGMTDKIPALIAGVGKLNDGVNALAKNNSSITGGMKQLSDGLNTLSSGLTTMQKGAKQLTGKNDELTGGASAVDQGVGKLQSGGSTMKKGMETYLGGVHSAYEGSDQLADGTAKLKGAGSLLTAGIDKLAEGSGTLRDGMQEFDEEGIQKISDLAGDDLQTVINHFKAVKKADKNYSSFSGKQKDSKGSVRFIWETEAIETEDN